MALLTDPEDRVYVWLTKHDDVPMIERPLFIVRNMSTRQRKNYYRELDDLSAIPSTVEGHDKYWNDMKALLSKHVVGWKNVNRPNDDGTDSGEPWEFSIDNLLDGLNPQTYRDLFNRIPLAVSLTEKDLGESSSPRQSAGAESAKTADAASA